ncbi:MAG: hypothetical protein GYA17_03585 [Chloroflexi bacterium]|jgi:hypothetical protein|nr:hypothetical protein [Anaerolineaceae bacterium]NMB87416.1 hypothetical protein [Chloroflexota bacterium]
MSKPTPNPELRRRSARRSPADSPVPQGLRDEIAMLRTFIRRVHALSEDGRSVDELLRILASVGQASTRLANLLRAERDLGSTQDLSQALNEALEQVIRAMADEAGG